MIKVNNLHFSYYKKPKSSGDYVLQGINLEFGQGEITALLGPNGSGKSTLIRLCCGMLVPDDGRVEIKGEKAVNFSSRELAKFLGYVPQNSNDTFGTTVYEYILLGRRPYIRWKVGQEDRQIVEEVIAELGIEKLAERSTRELSGGERQKVEIARALAQEPEILLLDEPTASLDINHQHEVLRKVQELKENEGLTIVVVLHDLNHACRFAERMALLHEGRIMSSGRPDRVITPENVRRAYGIEVDIINQKGLNYVIPA